MQNVPFEKDLDTLFQVLKEVVMHPDFPLAVAEVQALPIESWTSPILLSKLKDHNIPIRAGFTITTEIQQNVAAGLTWPGGLNIYALFG